MSIESTEDHVRKPKYAYLLAIWSRNKRVTRNQSQSQHNGSIVMGHTLDVINQDHPYKFF